MMPGIALPTFESILGLKVDSSWISGQNAVERTFAWLNFEIQEAMIKISHTLLKRL